MQKSTIFLILNELIFIKANNLNMINCEFITL